MIFNELYNQINKNLDKKEKGGFTSISPPFKRLADKYPGWVKGTYTILTASSGVGKTKAAKFFAVNSVYNFIKANPGVKCKIFYFCLEESKTNFWYSIMSSLLYDKHGINLSPQMLMSLGNYTLDREILQYIESVQQDIDDMEKYIEVIDNVFNPYGIYQTVHNYFKNPEIGHFEKITLSTNEVVNGDFIYKDDDLYVFCVTDHISLLVPETHGTISPQKSLHEAMDYFSKEYCLKHMAKRLKCVVINIQQQSADKERQEFYKGQSIEKKLEPSLDGLADNKLCQRDADLVLGLFAPIRYELTNYRGYDIRLLKDNYRCLIFLKDRHFGLANNYVSLYFDGATNSFKELPLAKEMTSDIYNKIINKEF
jgi:replicative DNA helicase